MPQKSKKEFIYSINENHRIDYVNDAWLEFASENGATRLTKDDVLNKSIWSFIAGRDTEQIFDLLFKKLKSNKARIAVPFRCDSPDCRRFMMLEMYSPDERNIQFKSWVVKEEKRPAVELLNFREEKSDRILRMCSWCKKIDAGDERWVEVEDAVEELNLFDEAPLPQFTHTICPPCSEMLLHQIEHIKQSKAEEQGN